VVEPLEIQGPGAEVQDRLPTPVLIVLPDPEARAPLSLRILGRPPMDRLVEAARASGFRECLLGPGTVVSPPNARAVATGDRVGSPALVVFEGSYVHPGLLPLMVEHPLEPDERFTLYDDLGRPAACFVGLLRLVPAVMPVSEELPWPERYGPCDVVRVVYQEDVARCEALILRTESSLRTPPSWWRDTVDAQTLRWLTQSTRPLPQLELLALVLAMASLPVALLGGSLALWVGAGLLLVGVHISRSFPRVRSLRGAHASDPPRDSNERLIGAIRPLGQAAYMGALTYVIVAETHRSGAAALVLLAAGAAAVLLSLMHARTLLRGRATSVLALPDANSVARSLGMRWPSALDGAPFVELLVWCAAATGVWELPWSVLLATGGGRLWRWFSGPDDLFPRFREHRSSPADVGPPNRS